MFCDGLFPLETTAPLIVLPTMSTPPWLFTATRFPEMVFAEQPVAGSPMMTGAAALATETLPVVLPQTRTAPGLAALIDEMMLFSTSTVMPAETTMGPLMCALSMQTTPLRAINEPCVPVIVDAHDTVMEAGVPAVAGRKFESPA